MRALPLFTINLKIMVVKHEQINSLLIEDNLPETSAFLCYSGFVPKLV
jgi:hypothetical protein